MSQTALNELEANGSKAALLGFWIAILLAILTSGAFSIGVLTPPRSGAFCTGPCIAYPYADAARFFPQDYFWMLPAILLTPLFVILTGCVHSSISEHRRVYSLLALCFSSISATLVMLDYFVQIEVVAPSLMKGEPAGVALFTQYNPRGLFIALEDLGYLMMSAAFLWLGFSFSHLARWERWIRWTLITGALLGFAAFFALSWRFGTNLDVRFEIAIITIDWPVLIAVSTLLAVFFRRMRRKKTALPGR